MAKRLNVTQELEKLSRERGFAPDMATLAEERRQFIAQNLAGIPADYSGELGMDPAKWPAEAGRVKLQHRIDQGQATGAELLNAGIANETSQGAGGPPLFTMPPSKAEPRPPSPLELIRQGMGRDARSAG